MSTNSLNWKKLNFVEYGDNYSICMEFPYDVRNDNTGRILKPHFTSGHYQIRLNYKKKQKPYYHHVLIWISHFGVYDNTKFVIDHIDPCGINNHIENLRLVTRSINTTNMSYYRGRTFDYYSELPDKTVINNEHGIYYCKQYDKFFRKVVDKYRELHETKQTHNNGTFIQWIINKKHYRFTTTFFRDNL